jgi:hypothetical protein
MGDLPEHETTSSSDRPSPRRHPPLMVPSDDTMLSRMRPVGLVLRLA